jgi:putative phage-type endonuclease
MNKNLQFIDTRSMTRDQWLMYRKTGVGASEVGTIMGLNVYKSSIELFYEKLAEGPGYTVENIHMFMGTEQESMVANFWQYWGGSEESMMLNYRAGNIVRKCRRLNAYVRNPKFPWLFVSLDRVINKTDDMPEGALECKTIMGWEANKWEAGIPPGHVVQVQTQVKVCEFSHGELATLKDGRRFEVTPFEFNKNITESIVDHTHDFWQRVERAREVLTQRYNAQRTFNLKAVEELTQELETLEPAPDGSEAYVDFLNAKYKKSVAGERSGTITELKAAQEHLKLAAEIKELEEKRRLRESKLKLSLGEMDRLTFGKNGFVSWKSDVNGVRRFVNKVKA